MVRKTTLAATLGVVAGQCVVVCYSVLQCVAVCCSVLQCVAVCCSVGGNTCGTRGVVTELFHDFRENKELSEYCEGCALVHIPRSQLLLVLKGKDTELNHYRADF